MSKSSHRKIFASDAMDELLQVKSKHKSDFWLLSYLDVFVLVVMLMVSIVSITDNSAKKHKVKTAKKSSQVIQQPAQIPAPGRSALPVVTTVPPPPVDPTHSLAVQPMKASEPSPEEQIQHELNDKIEQLGLQAAVKMSVNKGFAQLDIADNLLFQSSAVELSEAGQEVLAKLIPLLQETVGLILIEGHTDNRPMKSGRFKSNWELSSARATSVLYYLASQEIEPERMRAISYADTRPIADNETPAGRERNRRVNIIVQYDNEAEQIKKE